MSRIAIIGAGISGLGAARLLAPGHDVVVYEAQSRVGGHARTLEVAHAGAPLMVDTGFIVYNETNYPNLVGLFAELGVETIPTDMSFGVSVGGLELCGSSLRGVFAQSRNALRPAYWRMLRDIVRFFEHAPGVLDRPGDPSLGDLLDELRLGGLARDHFLLPMGAAIWSTPTGQMADMPAKTFVRFFKNHNLLSLRGHHPWRTVKGGSIRYVSALMKTLTSSFGVAIRSSAPVHAVEQAADGRHCVITAAGDRDDFDEVVFACHADRALSLLKNPTEAERKILSAFTFRDNHAVLHTDSSVMPHARAAWASWVFTSGDQASIDTLSVTYWMNRLQGLPGSPLLVTLNPVRPINGEAILDRHTFRHPVLSRAAVTAQSQLPHIQGCRGLWFAGAWTRYGFHEDGLASAVSIAERKGMRPPW